VTVLKTAKESARQEIRTRYGPMGFSVDRQETLLWQASIAET
jgi:hypothetical protein